MLVSRKNFFACDDCHGARTLMNLNYNKTRRFRYARALVLCGRLT
jgi:hypothetical protein